MTETSTDLAAPENILNPVTGELVPRTDLPALAQNIELLRARRRSLDNAIAAFGEPFITEARRGGGRTFNLAGLKVVVSADTELQWDVTVLTELLDLGLPVERYAQLVEETVSYKVNGSVATQIAAANPEYAEVIGRAKGRVPKRQSVSVKP